MGFVSAEAIAHRLELYHKGWSDAAIAREVGLKKSSMHTWRRKQGLPPHTLNVADPQRLERYDAGLNDGEIAAIEGVTLGSITLWRQYHKLPRNFRFARTSKSVEAFRLELYHAGKNDAEIAKAGNATRKAVQKWRQGRGLPTHPRHLTSSSPERGADLLRRVNRAVGRWLPADVKDDAAQELILAVIEGRVKLQDVQAHARRFGSRELSKGISNFGAKSLNEAVAGTDDLFGIDLLRDDSHSDWLEEMGATVW